MFPDLGSTQQQAAIIVGFFLPLGSAIVMQSHWRDTMRTLVSVGPYAAAGATTAAAAGTFTGKTFWQSALTVLALGVVGYKGVWQPSGLALGIETKTNFSDAAQGAGKVRLAAAEMSGNPARVAAQVANTADDRSAGVANRDAAVSAVPSAGIVETFGPVVDPLGRVLEQFSQHNATSVGAGGTREISAEAAWTQSGSSLSVGEAATTEDPR